MKQYLAIDVGGTMTKYALVSEAGDLSEQGKQSTVHSKLTDFTTAMVQLIQRYQTRIAGIGLALPGVVDPSTGMVKACAALPFLENVALTVRLTKTAKINVPIVIENDGNAAALAEFWRGQLAGTTNSAMVVLGTGVGASLFINGQLYTGSHQVGGEPSFMVTNGLRPITRDQTAAGLSAVKTVNAMAAALNIHRTPLGPRVFQALKPDTPAAAILDRFTRGVAAMIYNIQTVLDLEKIVIGGGISAQPRVIEAIQAKVAAYRNVTELAAKTIHMPVIEAAKYRNEANLIGAVVALLQRTNIHSKS
ncbi:ROK family protein [Lacticaseibacillus chiayiensis]|uniref:ROK family protein n=1 Tax=Lacticaseibacillus chiayiensis TaxID=2100821 RepID=UPI001BCD4121|nr:ROK family protein [Lacticaseibacillus chiayiensis]QVI34617.1 ROK family protein [Lacticaseibacillus chiayiensis]